MESLVLLFAAITNTTTGGLGDNAFAAREAAQERLTAAGWLAAPALLVAEQSADPEVRHRARFLLDHHHGAIHRAGLYLHAASLLWIEEGPTGPPQAGEDPTALPEGRHHELQDAPDLYPAFVGLCQQMKLLDRERDYIGQGEWGEIYTVNQMRARYAGRVGQGEP